VFVCDKEGSWQGIVSGILELLAACCVCTCVSIWDGCTVVARRKQQKMNRTKKVQSAGQKLECYCFIINSFYAIKYLASIFR